MLFLYNKYKIFYNEELFGLQKIIYYGINRIKYLLTIKNKTKKCGWGSIAKLLTDGLLPDEIKYIEQSVINYIDEVFRDIKTEKLYIVVHPHRNHYYSKNSSEKYIVSWEPILKKIIFEKKLNNKVFVIDFDKFYPKIYNDKGIKTANIFIDGDISSHLVESAHGIMLKKILLTVDQSN